MWVPLFGGGGAEVGSVVVLMVAELAGDEGVGVVGED